LVIALSGRAISTPPTEDDPMSEEPEMIYRLKVEDRDLEPVDDHDVYTTEEEALSAYSGAVLNPDPEWGSVYLTEQGYGDEGFEAAIAGHCFDGQEPEDGPRFPLGLVVSTPGAIKTMEHAGIAPGMLLRRHLHGDWGDVCAEDAAENEFAVGKCLRIFSVYGSEDDPNRLWVITEADRSSTCILRPDEY
jgi:hypothetical protein